MDPSGHWWLQDVFKAVGDVIKQIFSWLESVTGSGWSVNVGGSASIQFDIGPSSNSHYSSSNPSPSSSQTNNGKINSSSGSSSISQDLPTTAQITASDTQATNDRFISSLNTSYGTVDGAGTGLGSMEGVGSSNLLDTLSSPWVQMPISAVNKGGSAYASIWQATIEGNPHTSGWTKGIGNYNRLQSGFQAAGVVQSSLFYWNLYQKAVAQNLSQPQINAASFIHGAGFGVGLVATELGKRWGMSLLAAKLGIGATMGGTIGAAVVGIIAGVGIYLTEKKLNESVGIK